MVAVDRVGHFSNDDHLVDVLREAQALGFLGSRPVEAVIDHARGFLGPCGDRDPILDLGSGGGVPGLVIASARPMTDVVLLDSSGRRTDWLRRAVQRLGWGERITVLTARAELVGRDPTWRERSPAVVARGFGSPAVTAECAAALVTLGGVVVVSEPPTPPVVPRWPAAMLAEVGLAARSWPDPAFVVLEKVQPCAPNVPRQAKLRRPRST
jgi:16S rRNA (guanine527-N7)-methyltransferase